MNITEKQLIANQKNAKKGGVKTDKGKEIVKYNALKHGILSSAVILKGESEDELNELKFIIEKDFKPSSFIESFLVERIITGVWRLRRVLEVEKRSMEWQKARQPLAEVSLDNFDDEKIATDRTRLLLNSDEMEKVQRYETSIERGIYRAIKELRELKSK